MSDKIIKNSRNTENAPKSAFGTQTVAFSHYNNISAQLPIDPKTGKIVAGGVQEQAVQVLENITTIVESVGHIISDVVRVNIYLKNITDLDAVNEVYATFFSGYLPTRTALAVAELPESDALVMMDAVISNGEGTHPQDPCDLVKMVRNTPNAPLSALSTQTVAFSHYNHISAQLPICPKSGKIVGDTAQEQASQCLANIKAIMEAIDAPFDDIVKVNIHLKNLADIDAVNQAYKTFFPDSAVARAVSYLPARSIVAATGLPMDALVQMDATISHGDGTPPQAVEDRHNLGIRARNTDTAPKCAVSTHTVAFSHYNNISGQLPLDAKTGKIVGSGAKEQTMQAMNNIKAIVECVEHSMDDIVKINIQLKNIADLKTVTETYASFFTGDLPACTIVGVSAIPMGALVQIDAIVSNCESTPPAK